MKKPASRDLGKNRRSRRPTRLDYRSSTVPLDTLRAVCDSGGMKITVKVIEKPTCSFEKAHPVELTVSKVQRLNLTVAEAQELQAQLNAVLGTEPR